MAYNQAEHAISELDYFISRVRSSILPVLWCEPVAKAWHWLRGESRAMADVRTLDDWADAVDDRSVDLSCGWLVAFKDKPHLQPPGQIRVRLLVGGDPVHIEYGATPDEARAKAAARVREQALTAARNADTARLRALEIARCICSRGEIREALRHLSADQPTATETRPVKVVRVVSRVRPDITIDEACTCGAYSEPDYSDGDHIAPCPRAKEAAK